MMQITAGRTIQKGPYEPAKIEITVSSDEFPELVSLSVDDKFGALMIWTEERLQRWEMSHDRTAIRDIADRLGFVMGVFRIPKPVVDLMLRHQRKTNEELIGATNTRAA